MTYDHELILIGETYASDAIGNQIPVETETVVFCGLRSVSRAEFYSAAVTDLRPELVFVIHAYEYNGEQKVKFEGVKYRVIRTYQTNTEEMELVVEKVSADG